MPRLNEKQEYSCEEIGEDIDIRTKHNGLCFDCENKDDCCLTAVEGGVWHCEEYC